MSVISLKVASWQDWQTGKTLRIKPEPAEFEEYPGPKEKTPRQERNWWKDKVRNGKIVIYTINHSTLGLVGFIKAFNINKAKLRCEVGVEILDSANYGKGWAFLAGQDFLHILTNQYHLHHYHALIHPENERSLKLFTKLEFKHDIDIIDDEFPTMIHKRMAKSI